MNKLIPFILSIALAACVAVSDGQTIRVYKPDGARQCEGAGISVQEMQKELAGILVYGAEKSALQDVMFPAVCGGGTGSVNVYTIAEADVKQAQARGFALLSQNAQLPKP